ncbi:uncharacterized protein TRUGW13939_01969 [Talaromyces rugulosus]|uniref:Uncharacterized protein n=1 Tax=Talaromyces rugulosus TaxID=121627 RepID=A0A7H8QLR2_TALRU|nr:uncharacterized protein TRUGW13939_01969 [Talaromyces rugulosus]QKX54879.1 hypothetical protein TRUGW13939_01969 [Talaromyces rugulosus]
MATSQQQFSDTIKQLLQGIFQALFDYRLRDLPPRKIITISLQDWSQVSRRAPDTQDVLPNKLNYERLPGNLRWVQDEVEIWFLERKVRQETACLYFVMQEGVSSLFPTNCNLEQLCNKDERGETIIKPLYYLEKACYLAFLCGGREGIKNALDHAGPLWPEFAQNSLIVAAFIGEEGLIRWLLEKNVNAREDINTRSKLFGTALLAAVLNCSSRIASLLLNCGARQHGMDDLFGWAVMKNDVEMVQLLLSYKHLDPNKHFGPGVDPVLFIACKHGFSDMVQVLLNDPRIDPYQPTHFGMTPLLAARRSGNEQTMMIIHGRGVTDLYSVPIYQPNPDDCPLLRAAAMGQDDTVKLLLQRPDLDPNLESRGGLTPLMVAARNNHEDVIDSLLKSDRVDPNMRCWKHGTVLISAAERGQTRIVEMLLQRKDIDVNIDNQKVIAHAAINGHEGCFDLLVERIDPKIMKGELGKRGFLLNVVNRRIMLKLLDRFPQLKINKRGAQDGRTLLIHACVHRNIGLVEQLLERGADPEMRNYSGRNALDYARKENLGEYVELLQRYQSGHSSAGA